MKQRFTSMLDMSKKRRGLTAICIIILVSFIIGSLVACSKANQLNSIDKKLMTEHIDKMAHSPLGAVMPSLDYASDERVVLHGYFGLIVYDIKNEQIYRTVDLSSIDMNYMQGDKTTIVKVKNDGSEILIYNEPDSEVKYLYNIEKNELKKTEIPDFESAFSDFSYFDYEGETHVYTDDNNTKRPLKYSEGWLSNCYVKVGKHTICYLIYPSEYAHLNLMETLQIVMLNGNTNQQKIYSIFGVIIPRVADGSLKELPELTVTVGNKSITAVRGTSSWEVVYEGGTRARTEAESAPPSLLVKHQKESLIVEPKSSIILDFKNMPDYYSIWEGDNPITQQVNDNDEMIIAPQQKGLVVYVVHARWNQGNAYYAFSVNVE